MKEKTARIGIYLCKCGGRISSKVNLEAIKREVKGEPFVAACEILGHSCLAPGLEKIRRDVRDKK